MTDRWVIGVDGGGTRSTAVCMDGRGTVRGRGEAGPGALVPGGIAEAVQAVAEAVARAAEAAGARTPVSVLCAGLAGAGQDDVRRDAGERLGLAELAGRVRVVTDAEAALAGAFGDRSGAVLMAGTGSMALGRDSSGALHRTGGWGAIIGDEGSGYWIGLEALRAVARATDGRGRSTVLVDRLSEFLGRQPGELARWVAESDRSEVADLTPVVLGAAAEDPVARDIVWRAAEALLEHVRALARALATHDLENDAGTVEVALCGALLLTENPVSEAVRAGLGALPSVSIVEREADAAVGAARLALAAL